MRAQYLQDWLTDPASPMTWRLDKDKAGSGALGDIGAHIVDLTQFITGDRIVTVNGLLETFVHQRPVADRPTASCWAVRRNGAGQEMGEVTVDDAAAFLARFGSGAVGVFEATRFATGRKNAIRIEINGSDGQPRLRLRGHERPGALRRDRARRDGGLPPHPGHRAGHPYVGAWWPPGHGLGYEHGFTHQVVDLVTAIGRGEQPLPSFADGLQVQRVLDAVETQLRRPGRGTPRPPTTSSCSAHTDQNQASAATTRTRR